MTVDAIEIESFSEDTDKGYATGYMAKVNGVVVYEQPLSVENSVGFTEDIHEMFLAILAHYNINAVIKELDD